MNLRTIKGKGKVPRSLPSLRGKSSCYESMADGDIDEFLSTLEHRCSGTGKKNSKGKMEWFIGYKAHIALTTTG